jgi:hypothetical protein
LNNAVTTTTTTAILKGRQVERSQAAITPGKLRYLRAGCFIALNEAIFLRGFSVLSMVDRY